MTAALDAHDIRLSFDGVHVLNGLSFRLDHGELRFLIGPNGAGKTTLLDVLTGRVRPQSGSVIYDGRLNVLRCSIHEIARQGISRKFQSPSVFASLTVRENLEVAAGGHVAIPRLFSRHEPKLQEIVADVLGRLRLESKASLPAAVLSHGEQQWLEIGMLLVQRPKVLLLDEPVAGMTRAERDRTGELLTEISEDHSVLIVEHDMHFVRQFSAMVTVLHQGQVLMEGPMSEVQANDRVIDVYLGRAGKPPAEQLATPQGV